jgi:hypothetical protein
MKGERQNKLGRDPKYIESPNEVEWHLRNDRKFDTAKNNYILTSQQSYTTAVECLDLRYEYINPVINIFSKSLIKFFKQVNNAFANLENINETIVQGQNIIKEKAALARAAELKAQLENAEKEREMQEKLAQEKATQERAKHEKLLREKEAIEKELVEKYHSQVQINNGIPASQPTHQTTVVPQKQPLDFDYGTTTESQQEFVFQEEAKFQEPQPYRPQYAPRPRQIKPPPNYPYRDPNQIEEPEYAPRPNPRPEYVPRPNPRPEYESRPIPRNEYAPRPNPRPRYYRNPQNYQPEDEVQPENYQQPISRPQYRPRYQQEPEFQESNDWAMLRPRQNASRPQPRAQPQYSQPQPEYAESGDVFEEMLRSAEPPRYRTPEQMPPRRMATYSAKSNNPFAQQPAPYNTNQYQNRPNPNTYNTGMPQQQARPKQDTYDLFDL